MTIPRPIVDHTRVPDRRYRHVFLVQNRDYWAACPFPYDRDRDLVLTFDFGLVHDVTLQGGTAAYLDHLVPAEVVQRFNFETYDFFAGWHRDKEGVDLFAYHGIEVGSALRLEIWNDLTYMVRILINLLAVRTLAYEKLFAGVHDAPTLAILQALQWDPERWSPNGENRFAEYAFPIFRWMDERVRPTDPRTRLKQAVKKTLGTLLLWGDRLRLFKTHDVDVFVQPYYPTRGIVERLTQDGRVNVILEHFTWTRNTVKERRLPVEGSSRAYVTPAKELVDRFWSENHARWEIEGVDIGNLLCRVIVDRISPHLPDYLRTVDRIIEYFSRRRLALMVLVTETWMTNRLVMNYCQARGIPTYLICNGLLASAFLDEAKHATVVNSYGESIRDHYFRGMDNVVCLGDPRMDYYVNHPRPRGDPAPCPTIVIGAAGFSNVDLNSYIAFEFDFLYDVMSACTALMRQGRQMSLALKVRSNGYAALYADFLRECFPDVPVKLYDQAPFREIVAGTDLYISFYSQTLFEVSCWGIPALYYRKDTQILDPPFDGASELVTAHSVNDLIHKIEQFYQHDPIFSAFQDRRVLEKYLGPLDGHNLERNVEFIYSLVFGGRAPGGT